MTPTGRPKVRLEGRGDAMVVKCASCSAVVLGPHLDGKTRRKLRYSWNSTLVSDSHVCREPITGATESSLPEVPW